MVLIIILRMISEMCSIGIRVWGGQNQYYEKIFRYLDFVLVVVKKRDLLYFSTDYFLTNFINSLIF